jgi:hypothetical protein
VRIGAPDPSLTAISGIVAVAEFVDKLDVVDVFDRGIGSIKQRDRGATAGELLVGMAQAQLLGAEALVGLDRQRTTLLRSSCRWCRCWPRPPLRVWPAGSPPST